MIPKPNLIKNILRLNDNSEYRVLNNFFIILIFSCCNDKKKFPDYYFQIKMNEMLNHFRINSYPQVFGMMFGQP